jgi:hypothetical protein
LNQVSFEESEAEHADRLGVSPGYVRSRRRLLIERLGSAPAPEKEVGHLPVRVRNASTATLLACLQVSIAGNESSPGGAQITVIPVRVGRKEVPA